MIDTHADLDQLRKSIAAGSYVVDTDRVADTMVRKIVEAERIQRLLSQYQVGRTR